jgi:Flp pilus assembly protein TadD
MKHIDARAHARRTARLPACAAALTAALVLSACGALKDQYAATADAQQRAAAVAAAETKSAEPVDSQATYLRLVEQMQKEGLWFASLAHIDALEQRWGVSPESTRMRADALRQTGQAEASAQAYKRLMGTPLEGAGYRGLGLLAGGRGGYAEAVQLLKQAQRQAPTDAALLSDLGYASMRAGRIAEARLPLMQALQLRPDSAQAQSNLALYLEATGQREQADRLMEANRMSPAARAAVRDAAQQLRGGGETPLAMDRGTASSIAPPPVIVGTAPARDEQSAPPLMLKASRWAGMGGVRTASQSNPSAADPALSLSPSTSSRGTP